MASALKAATNHITEGLEKVRENTWAEPLGKTLQISGTIVNALGTFVPGAVIVGGALSFGALLLYPRPSRRDLQKDLKDIKVTLMAEGFQTEAATKALKKELKEVQEKIDNPLGETKENIGEIKMQLKNIFKQVEEIHVHLSKDMTEMKDDISKTYHLVTDCRYKVSQMFS